MTILLFLAAWFLEVEPPPPPNPASPPVDESLAGEPTEKEPGKFETVITATRIPTPPYEQPRAMTVVTEDDLAHRPARTTPEALAEQDRVLLQKTNHGGGAPIIRGLYGQQILLLEDGVRLNNATVRSSPNQFLNTVDPFVIEQLEVVRGPGSVLYGSDALGGVINVLSFRPRFSEE